MIQMSIIIYNTNKTINSISIPDNSIIKNHIMINDDGIIIDNDIIVTYQTITNTEITIKDITKVEIHYSTGFKTIEKTNKSELDFANEIVIEIAKSILR